MTSRRRFLSTQSLCLFNPLLVKHIFGASPTRLCVLSVKCVQSLRPCLSSSRAKTSPLSPTLFLFWLFFIFSPLFREALFFFKSILAHSLTKSRANRSSRVCACVNTCARGVRVCVCVRVYARASLTECVWRQTPELRVSVRRE